MLYKDDRVLFPSPRPRQLFRAASTDPGDRDVERSRASLEAYERERAANLALGCIIVDADSRAGDHAGDITKRAFFRTAVQSSSEDSEAADEATAAALVEAMGGAQIIPRRLVLAAGRVHDHPVSSEYGSRLHLERAFQYSMDKSVVLDSLDVARRLSWFAVKALLTHRSETLVEAVFREKVCEAAGLSATDSSVVWREAMGGAVPPFTPSYVDPLTHERREVGDVRPGDVAVLEVIGWLWPALAAFALAASAQGDPAKCFTAYEPCVVAVKTFEDIVIRQEIIGCKENGSEWSLPLAVLDDLAYRRDGEEDDAPGQARVAVAVASLLAPERVPTFAVGAQVEYGEGESTAPRNNPVAWVTASVTEVNASTGIATIRTEGANETKTVGLGALREGPSKVPCAAAVVLAHAVADHRNDIVLQILSSPLLASPLSLVVGKPGAKVNVRGVTRATALDHAIASRNIVAVGLLTKNYACSWKRWEAVLSTCDSLEEADEQRSTKEGSLVDLSCALRLAPGVFLNSLNAFGVFEAVAALETRELKTEADKLGIPCLIAARDGDAARARTLFETLKEKCDAGVVDLVAVDQITSVMLTWAAKSGSAAVIDYLLTHHNRPVELEPAVRIAIADGHIHCLESLLVVGQSLTNYLARFSPDAIVSVAPLKAILEAVQMDDGAALDLMRSRGVRLGPFDGPGMLPRLQPIDAAAQRGSPSAVRAILRDPSVVQWIMARKSDAIMRACDQGHSESLAALLERVQLIHTKENSEVFGNSSPLLQACTSRSLATVEIVLAHGVDVNEKLEGRRSALACAAGLHAIDIATELLKRGASVGSPSDLEQTALTYGLNNSENIEDASLRNSMVQLLLRHDANLAEHYLYWVKKNWLKEGQLQAFLDAGANPSVSDSNGVTPLHINVFHAKVLTEAANAQHDILENITTLVLAGADLTAKTTADTTSNEEAGFPLFDEVLPGGLTPMQVAETVGCTSSRENVVAHLTAAIAMRAL